MADTFGALSFPLTSPSPGERAGDPALDLLGKFLQASVNAACNGKWNAVGVSPGRNTINHVFLHDPSSPGGFDENRLPALYLWRSQSNEEREADGLLIETTRIEVGWIAEASSEDHYRARDTMKHAIAKAIRRALRKQRDPAWVVTGDTDPVAAGSGSLINTWTGFERILPKQQNPKLFTFERIGNEAPLPYYGFSITLDVTEYYTDGPAIVVNTGIETLRTNDDATTDQTVTYPLPT